jgi:high-affinity nickel-transport protein
VALACAGVAMALGAAQQWMPAMRAIGGVAGTLISAGFLFAIATVNLNILLRLMRARSGKTDVTSAAAPGGPATVVLGSLFAQVRRAPAMFVVGMLFGLGFDTASEIGLLGMSAGQAAHAAGPWSIMLYPMLFAAGMSLADTFDGVLMARAYGWALREPRRRLNYNLAVTALSAAAALAIGGVEATAVLSGWLNLKGHLWSFAAGALNHSALIGLTLVGLLLALWAWARQQRASGSLSKLGDSFPRKASEVREAVKANSTQASGVKPLGLSHHR